MLPTSAAWRTPPATRSASRGRPASTSPGRGSPRTRSVVAGRVSTKIRFPYLVARLVPALRQGHIAGYGIPAETAQRVSPPGVTKRHEELTSQPPGLGPIATDLGGHGLEHGEAGLKCLVYGRAASAPRRLVYEFEEPAPVDEQMAPRVIDHGLEVAGDHGVRDGGDGAPDCSLPAAVVQQGFIGGQSRKALRG